MMVDSARVLWNRRPINILILTSVQVWSGQPYATGPSASSFSSTVNRGSLSLQWAAGPGNAGPVARRSARNGATAAPTAH